ncbi:MAG: metal-dependent hydrolase [Deltaproteobacteria bacterium]|nr:metal-dependent hydrolase [Deltaproteobacteria bacterium]
MDPLTHTLSGVLLSRTGFYQKWGRPATIALVVGAVIPDIDHITLRLLGPIAYLKYHRGFTHSIIGIMPLAILIAFWVPIFFKQTKERIDYLNLAGLGILGIIAHIFLDLITSYGTQIFFPFDNYRYSLDLVFIIDPYFSLIFILPPILWTFKKEKARTIAVTAIIMIFAYLAFAYATKNLAAKSAKAEMQRININASRIEAIPMPLSPFKWSVFIEDEKRFYQMDIDIVRDTINTLAFDKISSDDAIHNDINKSAYRASEQSRGHPRQRRGSGRDEARSEAYFQHTPQRRARSNAGMRSYDALYMIKKADSLEMVKVYKWFARFPVVTMKMSEGEHIIEYYDIRFNSMPPRKPFLLKVVLDKDGVFKDGELFFHSIKP